MSKKYDLNKMSEILIRMNLVPEFLESCFAFQEVWNSNIKFQEFLANQTFPIQDKLETIEQIFKNKLSPAFKEFVFLILTNSDILKNQELLTKLYNILGKDFLIAKITTAEPLTAQQFEQINKIIQAKTSKKVFLRTELNPSILGGLILRYQNFIYDLSLKNKLTKLQTVLR